ncbi:MFS transporter [Actinoplanes sp. CA-252034]|uniref:MFS transporter n=1 Tax=Actinoplanes sp. CA-252034 TaxID=3239906 RepID=UPI003D97EA58
MRNLLAGYYTSILGSQMTPVALAFAVLASGHGVSGLGLVLGASRLPTVGFILLGGVLADRVSRRTLLLATDVMRGAGQATLAVWIFTGHVPLAALMIFASIDGLGSAFFRPALGGIIPSLNEPAALQRANALIGFGRSLGSLVGPATGGVLVAAFSPGVVFAVDAVSYLVSALFLLGVPRVAAAPRTGSGGVLADLREGWAEFSSRRWLWSLVAQSALFHLLVLPAYMVLGPQLAADGLGGPRGWGFILGGFGAGALLAGLVMARVTQRHPLRTAVLANLGFVPALLLLALSAPLPAVILGAFAAGAGMGTYVTLWETSLQANVPREVLSRVVAYDWFGSLVTLPLGFVVVGFAAPAVGAVPMLLLGAAVVATTSAAALALPDVRRLTSGPVHEERPV